MEGHVPLPSGGRSPKPSVRRRGVFRKTIRSARWLLVGGSDWAGVKSISRGAALIGDLAPASRSDTSTRGRVIVDEDRTLDLRATAFSQGMTEDALLRHLDERRRQTVRIAYGTFTLACLFLIGWLHGALHTPSALSRIMLAVDFLPFCALFFSIAFYNALINFQVRSGRRASWREYLLANCGFLPQ